jgi:hypothetical protein
MWEEAYSLSVLRKSPMARLGALVMTLALALGSCGDGGDDNDGGSGHTDTTVAPDRSDNSSTTPSDDIDPGY